MFRNAIRHANSLGQALLFVFVAIRTRIGLSLILVGGLVSGAAALGRMPEPRQSSSSSTAQSPESSSTAAPKAAPHKHTPFDDFLIYGTVFTDKGLAFSNVRVRIRRVGEKKFRWDDVTNSRGDFAFRVPKNASYEVVVHVKGFLDQTKTAEAKAGSTDQTLAFQMEPAGGKK